MKALALLMLLMVAAPPVEAAVCDGLSLADGRCLGRFDLEFTTESDRAEVHRASIIADLLFKRAQTCDVKDFDFVKGQISNLDIWLKIKTDEDLFAGRVADLTTYVGESC